MASEVLLGDEAVALGAIHGGISGAYSYPGTPATEIFEFVERRTDDRVHTRWSPNEKVAYEEALGMSWAGKRAIVSMKHVGLNVAADAFVNSAITGVGGGLVVVVADDPGMHSSQNEQDTRELATFAQVPCLEPRDQQQAYDFMPMALDLSERFGIPVVVRMVTRLAHSRAKVELGGQREQNGLSMPKDPKKWTLLPVNARVNYRELVETRLPEVQAWSESSDINRLELRGKRLGIISSGIATNYLEENLDPDHDYTTLHIGAYPLPVDKLGRLVEHVDEILVLEDGYPFIEARLEGLFGLPSGKPVHGRLDGALPRTGELNPDLVRIALGKVPRPRVEADDGPLPGRPPALCDGCPHDPFYTALNEALSIYPDAQVLSDIGCYTLGALPPHRAIHSCVCMGASVGMAMGAAHAGVYPVCSVIGDSTFAHGGLPGILSAAQEDTDMVLFILDNDYVAMTGGQPSAATNEVLDRLLVGLGVPEEHIRVIVPTKRNHEHNVQVIREEIAHHGLSVVISRRPCIHKKPPRKKG